jgi:hypothetical protein
MPVEIRELVLRVNLENDPQTQAAGPGDDGDQRRELIADCVARVLEILREKEER